MFKVGLLGYGKAGSAVAKVLSTDPRIDLQWIARRTASDPVEMLSGTDVPIVGLEGVNFSDWLDIRPVDALIDFSTADNLMVYGEEIKRRQMMLVSAVSAYSEEQLDYARTLGQEARVLCSPNMTLGINFLITAARLMRNIAPLADVEILEQHFKEKPEVSGTAKKIAASLDVGEEKITSMRLGGILGHHEVIFGFPYQTVRLTHDSIHREAFGTGAVFALTELSRCDNGFYSFDNLLMKKMSEQLMAA